MSKFGQILLFEAKLRGLENNLKHVQLTQKWSQMIGRTKKLVYKVVLVPKISFGGHHGAICVSEGGFTPPPPPGT